MFILAPDGCDSGCRRERGAAATPLPWETSGSGERALGGLGGDTGGSLLFGEGWKGATLGCEQGDVVLSPTPALCTLGNSHFGEVRRPHWSTQGWLSLLGAPKGCSALWELGESYSAAPISTPLPLRAPEDGQAKGSG